MPKYTKQQLEAQYEKLPDTLKDAIFSVEIAEHMFELGKKHGLTMEKTGFAAEETGFVILGFLPPREFAASLASRLDINKEKAMALASDINHQIFFPLREALKDAHHIEVGESAIRTESTLPRRTSGAFISEITRADAVPPSPMPPISIKQNSSTTLRAGGAPPAPKPIEIEYEQPPVPVPPTTTMPGSRAPIPQTPPAPRPFIQSIVAPKKTTVVNLAPLTPATTAQSQELKDLEKKTLTPTTPPTLPNEINLSGAATNHLEPPSQKPITAKPPETQKPPPIILRQKITEDLQKEIAPLVGGMPIPTPIGFLTRQETERIVIEKLADKKPISPPRPPPITTDPTPPTPLPPPVPKKPEPINLTPLPGTPMPIPPANPPLGTAKVPALDLRAAPKPPPAKTYDGFDPYKEPIE